MTTESNAPQDKVEATFELLAAAKTLESESDYWRATEKFVEAHHLLKILADEETAKATAGAGMLSPQELENTQRVATLYVSKANEYWNQSRSCLLRAMEQEQTRDEQDHNEMNMAPEDETGESSHHQDETTANTPGHLVCACTSLDEDQARARNRSFSVLFSRPLAEPAAAEDTGGIPPEGISPPDDKDEPPIQPQDIANEDDLASRLTALNQSLPSGFKSVDERMSDVRKGLGKLGVSSIYTQPTNHAHRFDDELPKDEDEQIEEILAQARDEAMMHKLDRGEGDGDGDAPHASAAAAAAVAADDDDESSFGDDSQSGDSEGDKLLENDQLAMKIIQRNVAKAQAKLAELLALVDQASSKRAKEEMEEEAEVFKNNDLNGDDDDSDEDSFREVQKHDVAFLMMSGKTKLKSAQRNLKKALAEWEDLIL